MTHSHPMRIRLWSDLHLEMSGNRDVSDRLPDEVDADLVLLAGDIAQGVEGVRWAAKKFRDTPVAYVLGNHEFYGHDLDEAQASARKAAVGTNVRVLEKDVWDFTSGLRILGVTLWTNYALWGSHAVGEAMLKGLALSDFRHVTLAGRRFVPTDALRLHGEAIGWLGIELARSAREGVRTIVLTHHAPDVHCIGPEYAAARDDLSPSFASDHSELLQSTAAPAIWCSGHTHTNYRGKIGRTMLLSNQAGYVFRRECPDFVPEGLLLEP